MKRSFLILMVISIAITAGFTFALRAQTPPDPNSEKIVFTSNLPSDLAPTADFVQYFYFEVVKSYDGYIAFDGDKPDDNNSKIIVGLAYPDRPELDQPQVEALQAWAIGESGGGWEPPQNWIVLASL